ALDLEKADKMIENVIGTFQLPLGLGLNFLINNKEYKIPMAVEEPSIIASASYIAKLVRDAGGFKSEVTERVMTGQIQVVGCEDFNLAKKTILEHQEELIELANEAYPSLQRRGGGAEDFDVRLLNESESIYSQVLVVQLYVDTRDAMGASMINTKGDSVAASVEA